MHMKCLHNMIIWSQDIMNLRRRYLNTKQQVPLPSPDLVIEQSELTSVSRFTGQYHPAIDYCPAKLHLPSLWKEIF